MSNRVTAWDTHDCPRKKRPQVKPCLICINKGK